MTLGTDDVDIGDSLTLEQELFPGSDSLFLGRERRNPGKSNPSHN